VKHGFVFCVEKVRPIAGPQAKAQNAETAAEQRRLVAIELHTDRCIPRNGVQTAANVGDGFLLHETPEYCIAAPERRNATIGSCDSKFFPSHYRDTFYARRFPF
jgi:hypothetical protein